MAGSFTVTAKNADGTTNTSYRGTVHFTSSDPQAVLPADYTFTAADGGVHTFSATLKTAGSQSITASDTVVPSGAGTQAGITVNPAAASRFTVAGFPSPVTAGVAGSFTVTAWDAYGNRATGYTGTVRFTSSDAKAVLPGNYTFTAADAGMHTFSAMLKTAGTQSLTATDTANAAIAGTQVRHGQPGGGEPAGPQRPGQRQGQAAFSLTVTVVDAYGNVVTGYRGTICLPQLGLDGQAAQELHVHGGRPGRAHLHRPGAEKEGQANHHGDRHAEQLPHGQPDDRCPLGSRGAGGSPCREVSTTGPASRRKWAEETRP